MAARSLAVMYRPRTFSDVVEQNNIKLILQQQLDTNTVKQAYLFCGGAGTGKTTSARIFANEINHGQGNPIELDAASHNSVDDVRDIIQQAKTKSLDSEYKVFILDEVHAISSTGWQAMLKIIEEPPAKCVFIFCTTDPQKIPKTILSRVQRYDFHRISHDGIVNRLKHIVDTENQEGANIVYDMDALDFISKIADGGMRDAITLLDKSISFSNNLTAENVTNALGTADYQTMFTLTDNIIDKKTGKVIEIVEEIHRKGLDLKQFLKSYMTFLLDVCKYDCTRSFTYLQMPTSYKANLENASREVFDICLSLLDCVTKLNAGIKWETSPKAVIEAGLVLFISNMEKEG